MASRRTVFLALLPAMVLAGAVHVRPAVAADAAPDGTYGPGPAPMTRLEKGGLAGISRDRLEAHTTASGELYNRNTLTAAHRSLPFGTLVRVTNLQNRRSVIVRINDRGSAVGNRVIDLTPRAADAIGLFGIGTATVKLEVLGASMGRLTPPEAADVVPVK
jgi:rare lipoprotein A